MTTAAAILTTAVHRSTSTAFCPSCEQHLPTDAFLAQRGRGDAFGAALCCRSCLLTDLAAERFLRASRRAARRDPLSPLGVAYAATKAARGRAVRAAARAAEGLSPAVAAA